MACGGCFNVIAICQLQNVTTKAAAKITRGVNMRGFNIRQPPALEISALGAVVIAELKFLDQQSSFDTPGRWRNIICVGADGFGVCCPTKIVAFNIVFGESESRHITIQLK